MNNHSARKTAVKKMQRKGLSRSDIIAITGHASEKGLDSYDEGDERQQKTLSNIIDGITPNSRPSQGCFTANQSPSVLTAPARRPPLQEKVQTSCSQGHVIIKLQHHILLFNNSSNINRHWENRTGLSVMFKVNMTCTIRHQILFIILQRQSSKSLILQIPLLHSTKMSSKIQRTCTSAEPIDVDAEIGLDFTLFPELLDWFIFLNRLLLQDVHLNFDLHSWRIILQTLHVKKLH